MQWERGTTFCPPFSLEANVYLFSPSLDRYPLRRFSQGRMGLMESFKISGPCVPCCLLTWLGLLQTLLLLLAYNKLHLSVSLQMALSLGSIPGFTGLLGFERSFSFTDWSQLLLSLGLPLRWSPRCRLFPRGSGEHRAQRMPMPGLTGPPCPWRLGVTLSLQGKSTYNMCATLEF